MNTNRLPSILAALFLALAVFVTGAAMSPQTAAAAPMADEGDIDWTSLELCAALGPDNCEATEDTWTFTAPAKGTVAVTFTAESSNTGPDRNEVVDYTTSNGYSGRLGTLPPLPNSVQVTYEVEEGDLISGTFTHAPKEPGRKGGSLKVHVGGHFEPTPAPVEPVCTGWSVTPATGFAPLEVTGSGSYTDPDGLVESVRVIWGDGNVTTDPSDLGSVPHTYGVGTHESQLVLVKADGGLVTGDACRAAIEGVEPPVETFEVQIGASCENHVLRGWVRGSASQEATLSVTATALNAEIGGRRQVGPGVFEFSAEKGGFEGLVAVEATATLTYESELVDEAEFSATLDCGTTPAPEPGVCVAATVSVANVPDEGAMVTVSAQAVGVQAVISVNGLQMGNAVPIINGAATFNVFVKPKDKIVVAVQGEDGAWSTTPACQLTIAGEPEKCPASFFSGYMVYGTPEEVLTMNMPPNLGGMDWQPSLPALVGARVALNSNIGEISGTSQTNGWLFTMSFTNEELIVNSPLGQVVVAENGQAYRITSVVRFDVDNDPNRGPDRELVTTPEIREGGHCGGLKLVFGAERVEEPVTAELAMAAPAWGGNAPADQVATGAPIVGSVSFGGQTVEMSEIAGSATSDWHQCGLRRDRRLVGCHVTDNTGQAGPGTALLGYQVGDTIEMVVDGQSVTLVVTGRQTVDRGPDWANRLDAVEAAAGGSAMTFFTCSGWDGEGYTTFTVLTTAPVG